jgi:predicted DNA-binding transcriptional regulator YafY
VKIPPLLFTEDEVGAVAAGLRVLEAWAPKDPAMAAAAAKLEQVLPRRLRRRARAMALSTRVLRGAQPAIEIAAIGILADAMADSSRVQFAYMDQHGRPSTRHTEPYRHILRRDHWYLIAFDLERDDWRLFRLDRLRNVTTTPGGAAPRAFPDTSLEHWLTSDFGRQEK